MAINPYIGRISEVLLGDRIDDLIKRVTLLLAMFGFVLHLVAWLLVETGVIELSANLTPLLRSPLLALYTPFSILLVYEVYQLIRSIPRSFSTAMAKQFEVITLIVVRDALVYLAGSDLSKSPGSGSDWFLLLAAKCLTFLLLLTVIAGFHHIGSKRQKPTTQESRLDGYVRFKQGLSVLLFLTFVAMVVNACLMWIIGTVEGEVVRLHSGIFFSDFFTLLIITDITILLISYGFTSEFGSLARNTGFVLATILMRVALDAPALQAALLYATSGALGIGVLWITGILEKQMTPGNKAPD